MIRVIHVVASLQPGGLERLVIALTNGRNFACPGSTSVCCLDEPGELAGFVEKEAVTCLRADRSKMPWDTIAVRRLKDLAAGAGALPVVFHAHNMAAWHYAVLAGLGTDVKLVYTQHGENVHNRGLRNRVRSMILARFTDHIVAVSGSTAGAMAKNQGIAARRIAVIANGIDVEKTAGTPCDKVANRVRLGIEEHALVIGSVGRLDYIKGYDRLITAFAKLVKLPVRRFTVSPFLLLIGDGAARANLELQARNLGVADRVIFAGYRDEASGLLEVMDVFVMPSRSEGISMALLEACAARLPVLVTDAGGNTEVVENGRTGLVVPAEDDAALQTGLLQLCNDAGLRAQLGSAASCRVAERFTLSATLENYERLYADSDDIKSIPQA